MDQPLSRDSSKSPIKLSTQDIRAGLQRIRKAQQQVLQQLKKNNVDDSIDVRLANSLMYKEKQQENDTLRQELLSQKQRDTEKSIAYRKKVVDLESELTKYQQTQKRYSEETSTYKQKIEKLSTEYQQLETQHTKLMNQTEKSNKHIRGLQKEILELKKINNHNDSSKFKLQIQALSLQKNSLMAEKVNLLKNYSKLQSENIELKMKIGSHGSQKILAAYRYQDVNKIIHEVQKMNNSHQELFIILKQNKKLSKSQIDKENNYQNHLNKLLNLLNVLQNNGKLNDQEDYIFNQQSKLQDLNKFEVELQKRIKKQTIKYSTQKQQLIRKNKTISLKLQQVVNQNKELQLKLAEIRKEKSEYIQQIQALTNETVQIKQKRQKTDRDNLQQGLKKQKRQDDQYRTIIAELNEQMNIIQKQKRDLDGLVGKMTNAKSQQQLKNKKKLNQIVEINQQIRTQNQKIKQKYESILVEKEHLYLSLNDCQNRNNNIGKDLAKEILNKQKLISELNKLKQQKELILIELQKAKSLFENAKLESQNARIGYFQQIQRVTQQIQMMRRQIQVLNRDRNQLRDLKGKYGLLLKDNQILGKKAKLTTGQIDHLWMIKEVEYQNLNKVIEDLKPL